MTTKTKKTLLRNEAKKLMWEYYKENKSTLPKWIVECREEILTALMKGQCVRTVFTSITENVAYDTQ